jgi:hypothetical protein
MALPNRRRFAARAIDQGMDAGYATAEAAEAAILPIARALLAAIRANDNETAQRILSAENHAQVLHTAKRLAAGILN